MTKNEINDSYVGKPAYKSKKITQNRDFLAHAFSAYFLIFTENSYGATATFLFLKMQLWDDGGLRLGWHFRPYNGCWQRKGASDWRGTDRNSLGASSHN